MLRTRLVRAFTLVEMMVVLLVITTLMSIGVSTWMSIGERSGSLATQELVSGMIQQARNRSSSQGLPVSLYFDPDGSITGIDQVYIWHQGFDWPAAETETVYRDADSGALVTAPVPIERSLGRNGYAWKYPYSEDPAQQLFLKKFKTKTIIEATATEAEIEAGAPDDGVYEPLFRQVTDGFMINCAVMAPDVLSAQSNTIPLLLITKKDKTDNVDNDDDLIAGIELWRAPQFILEGDTNGNGIEDSASPDNEVWVHTNIGAAWIIVGWIGKRPAAAPSAATYVAWDTLMNSSRSFVCDWTDASKEQTEFQTYPYTGQSWIDIRLAFDNDTMFLFRNGQHIESLPVEDFTPNAGEEVNIYVGRHQIGTDRYITEANIDDCSLIRIGSGTEHIVQNGIVPKTAYKITADNGLLECYALDETDGTFQSTNEIRFVDQSDQVDNLVFTIHNNGRIEKTILTSQDITGTP